MNHIVLYIIRRGILRWFRIWSQKIYLSTHLRENRVLKNLRGRIQKILISLNQKWNSDSKYTHISGNYISQALESLMCQKLKMLHNFWLMDQKHFWLGCMHTEFNADSDAKWVFSKFSIFQVNIPLRNFELNFAIFRKLRRQKKSKFRFLGQFLTLKNMVTKFFPNSNFSDFLGIRSEISQ